MLIETPYYHLSKVNRNGQIFQPRIPPDANRGDGSIENNTIKRICCSSEIDGCLKSSGKSKYKSAKFYVHKLIIDDDAVIITNDEIIRNHYVYDAEITKETWICSPAILKCIGVIRIKDFSGEKKFVGKVKGDKTYFFYCRDYIYEWIDYKKIKQKYSKYYNNELPTKIA